MSTPAKRLATTLRAITSDGKPEEVVALARAWGIDGRAARRAADCHETTGSMPVSAPAYLKLCGAIGIDPVTGAACAPARIGEFSWKAFGLGLSVTRRLRKHTMRAAADAIGNIGKSTICRAERGDTVSTEHVLAICNYIGLHPHHYTMFHGEQGVGQEAREGAAA